MPSMLENLRAALKQWERDRLLKFLPMLLNKLPNAKVYLVGGAVRDALLGIITKKDFDIVVQGIDGKSLEAALSTMGRVDLVGKTFGVFKFMPSGSRDPEAIDIALPRRDHAYGTGGYREVEVQSDPEIPIQEDLQRRDFTINAMALEIASQRRLSESRLVDPSGGFSDLRGRILRTVGTPAVRFHEDYSRLLRALRLTCQLNLTIEPQTWDALTRCMEHINDINGGVPAQTEEPNRKVPYEIVAKEFLKSFWWEPVRALDLYEDSGALKQLIPELTALKGCPHPPEYHSEGDVWAHTRLALSNLGSSEFRREFPDDPVTIETILGVLFHDIGKPTTLTTPQHHGTDRYRYHGHDKIGAEMTSAICMRLKFSSQPKESPLHVSCESLHWIVAKHLVLLNSKIEEMKASTIERYFFNPRVPGITLLQVIFADSMAAIPAGGEPTMLHFRSIKQRIHELLKLSEDAGSLRRRGLPPPLISGDIVMEQFHLETGPKIGKLLHIVREEQLEGKIHTKQQAVNVIRRALRLELDRRKHHPLRNPTVPLNV